MDYWYGLIAQGQKEPLAKARLEQEGFEVFLPLQSKRRVLFPGYIFAYAEADQLMAQISYWHSLRIQTGIHTAILSKQNTPIPIPTAELWEVMSRVNPITGIYEPDKIESPYQVGAKVSFKDSFAVREVPYQISEVREIENEHGSVDRHVDLIWKILGRPISVSDVSVDRLVMYQDT